MDAGELERAIDEVGAAHKRGDFFPKAWFDRLDLDDAYRIQLALIRRRCEETKQRRVGWKVGLTAKAIQEQFGFNEPVFGCLLSGGKVMSDFAVDVNHVYGDELYGVNKSEIMDGVDPTSFAIIGMNGGGTEYAKDKNHIYVTYPPFTPMQGVDMATFAIVGTNTMDPYGGYYARDKNNVYYEGLPVAGADPTTFLMASGADLDTIDARDKNHTYVSGHLAD